LIRAGTLRKTLYIQSRADNYGNPGAWSNISTNPAMRCSMKHQKSAESNGQSGERGVNTILVVARYRTGITYATRLTDGADRVFDIIGIQNIDERDRELNITVIESTVHNG